MNEPEYIKLDACVVRGIYVVKARNFVAAVWDGTQFLGERAKFGSVFVDGELHWDNNESGHGTVKPLQLIGTLDESVQLVDTIRFVPPLAKEGTLYGFGNEMLRFAIHEAYANWNALGRPSSLTLQGFNGEKHKRNRLKTMGRLPKYKIFKTDGTPTDSEAEYFVLRLDDKGGDPKHIAACRAAVLTYAENIKDHLPQLAKELLEQYGKKS